MSMGETRVYLVWTKLGNRFYCIADGGTEAIRKVDRRLVWQAHLRGVKEPADCAQYAHDWTDQDVLPAGKYR